MATDLKQPSSPIWPRIPRRSADGRRRRMDGPRHAEGAYFFRRGPGAGGRWWVMPAITRSSSSETASRRPFFRRVVGAAIARGSDAALIRWWRRGTSKRCWIFSGRSEGALGPPRSFSRSSLLVQRVPALRARPGHESASTLARRDVPCSTRAAAGARGHTPGIARVLCSSSRGANMGQPLIASRAVPTALAEAEAEEEHAKPQHEPRGAEFRREPGIEESAELEGKCRKIPGTCGKSPVPSEVPHHRG